MSKKHKSTIEWNSLKDSILGKHARKFDAILSDMDNEEFCNMYLKVLEFAAPKQQRTEVKDLTDPADQIVRIEYIKSESDKDVN